MCCVGAFKDALCSALNTLEWVQTRAPPELTVIPGGFFLALSLVLFSAGYSAISLASQGDQPPLLLSTEISHYFDHTLRHAVLQAVPNKVCSPQAELGSSSSLWSAFLLDKPLCPCTETMGGDPFYLRMTPLLYKWAPREEEVVPLVFLTCFSWGGISTLFESWGTGDQAPSSWPTLPVVELWPWKWKEALVL